MDEADLRVQKVGRICLRVGDLQRSGAFYHAVLGFDAAEQPGTGSGVQECVLRDDHDREVIRIVLTEGLPIGAYPTGMDHFSLEAPSVEAIHRLYDRAKAHQAQATHPRIYDGRWQSFLFDPDGYKIEVYATQPTNTG